MQTGTVTTYIDERGDYMTVWACPHCGRLFDLFDLCMSHARECDERRPNTDERNAT